MINTFSQSVIEKIKSYVYCLVDPRTNEIFYIGKGKGNRVFSHINDSLATTYDSDKLQQIRDIRTSGKNVIHYIIRHGLDHRQSLEIEATLIDFSRLCQGNNFALKNLVKGHDSFNKGLKTARDIVQFYDAKIIEIEEPVLIIIVNKLFWYGMNDDQLFEIVREKWRLDRNRIKNVKYVIASYLGIVREVYEVTEWYDVFDDRTQKMRVGFKGTIAKSDIRVKYLDGSLKNYKSNGYPNIYVNC